MDKLLEKEGISRPIWPTSTPGDPKQKGAVEAFWQTSKVYRGNVRTALIRAGLLDDPDKPKKLSEAIDFKGTCEDMCPEFEKITRIMEHDVQGPEKEAAPDGSLWPSPPKMVKALARSAAGQDAPLPMDVRSPAALRRTLDYLMHTVLGDDGNLPSVHGFLWDRTRAIRRDFVFQSSMNPSELADQVYCLERITRFHVIALHRMSRDDVVAEDFSEQQEIEQLGKALLSLIHAYEDCNAQSIHCENEAEFRAYYVLFNSHNTGILETVQDWGWRFWGESDQIRIAVSLVEALQNTWDSRGPLKPHSAIDIAQNAYSRFFSIVEDKQVSYTMACFAEIHFNTVRKSALKTILASYRKQRDQTKDWTLAKLNAYLWFDDEENIISFGESYGLQFGEIDDEVYLSFELGDAISDPFPPLKQQHSYSLVERKRGDNSLPAVIDKTVFERGDTEKHVGFDEISSWNTNGQGEGELELFVKDNDRENGVGAGVFLSESTPVNGDDKQPKEQQLAPIQDAHLDSTSQLKAFSKPASSSLFDNIAAPPKRFGVDFFTHKVAEKSSLGQRGTSEPLASASTKAQAKSPPFTLTSTLTPSSGTTVSTSPSSFVPQTPIRPSTESPKTSLSLGSYTISASPVPGVGAKPQFSFGDYAGTSPNGVPAIGIAQPNEVHFGSPREQHVTPPTKKSQLPYSGSLSSAAPDTTFVPLSSNPQIQAQTPKHTSAPQISSLLPSHEHKLSHASPSSTPQTPTFTNRKEKFSKFCEWFATGEHGLVDQFTAFSVEQILKNATRIYMNAEAERRAKEADALAREEADQFRYRALAAKYGRMWRDAAHRKWLRRRGREARRARQEMAENLRASKTVQSANIVEDFKASTNARRNSLESLLDATGVLNGVHDSNEKIRAIVQDEMKKVGAGPLRRRSERSTNSPSSSTSNIKRGNSDNPLRRSLMSDPSYLNGGSRIHLMSHYGSQDEERRHVSGVQTDYFRLKARGITTLPNGTPLASSVAHTALHKKRSFEYNRPITPELSVQLTVPRSAPTNNIHRGIPRGTTEREDDIQALKARAKAIIADEERSRRTEKKRSLDEGEDEELFARAKRIREQMDEGAQWFRNEIERSRSIS
jgi:nuclear mRNA export protein SAC3